MAIFWLGTLPMLVMVGASARRLLGFFGDHLPAVTCFIMVGVGLYTIISRGMLDPKAMAAAIEAKQLDQAIKTVPTPGTTLPCCEPEGQ
jgi:hypothetical protein